MRWADERYVRFFTRDTGDWLALSFDAQGLWGLLLRRFDRIGNIQLGRRGVDAVPSIVGHPGEAARILPALQELLLDGCVEIMDDGRRLYARNFLAAQDTPKSDAARQRDKRERDALQAAENIASVTNCHAPSRDVTGVTKSHAVPCRAVPCLTVPDLCPPPESATAAATGPEEPQPVAQVAPDPAPPDDGSCLEPQEPKAKKGPREKSAGELWFTTVVELERKHRLMGEGTAEDDVEPLAASEGISPIFVNTVVLRIQKATGWPLVAEPGYGAGPTLERLWHAYLDDPKSVGHKVPYSFRYFATDGVWKKYAAQLTGATP
jgi:hypothetical protein